MAKTLFVRHDGKITRMVEINKATLRSRLLAARPHDSEGLEAQLLALVHRLQPKVVASYQPILDEPDVSSFNQSAIVELVFPRITGDDLVFAAGEFSPGPFGILEPIGSTVENPDLILVPALAVDLRGNRLGRGRGFYDRTLTRFPKAAKYAVVFDDEVLEQLPADPWDVKVHGFVTPSRTVSFD